MKRIAFNPKLVFCLYSLFFLGLFSQFPLNESIPGNCDTLFSIAFGNNYLNRLQAALTGEAIGSYLYPSHFVYGYGETSLLGLSVLSFFRFLGFTDVIAYYFFISFIYISSAFAIFLLAGTYTENRFAALFAGFAFTCSNFSFANIDDSVVLLYFIAALSLYLLKKYVASQRLNYLYLSYILAGFQIYVNAYVFLFQFIMMHIVVLCNIRKMGILNRHFWAAICIHILILLPFISMYLYSHGHFEIINAWQSKMVILDMSLKPAHLAGVLPNNLIYSADVLDHFYWKSIRHHAFLGLCFYALVLIGLFKKQNNKKELVLIALAGLILAVGPHLKIGSMTFPCPMGFIYGLSPLFELFRVPLRAFFMTSLAFSICAAWGLSAIVSYFKRKRWTIVGYVIGFSIFFLHFIENTPFPLMSYDYQKNYEISKSYLDFFRDKKNMIVLDLPSTKITSFSRSEDPVYAYNREIVYMIWQTRHKQNTLNGVSGYFPRSRLEIQKYVDRLPALDLFQKQEIDYLVFHKDMAIQYEKESLLGDLKEALGLTIVHEGDDLCIFRCDL